MSLPSTIAVPGKSVSHLPMGQIEIDPELNLRKTHSPLRHMELMKSIPSKGLLQPMTVWEYEPGKYKLVAGFRRARAINALISQETFPQDTPFPVTVVHLASLTEAKLLNAAADEGHEPVKRFEVADRLDEMLTKGEVTSVDKLAEDVGMPTRVVDTLIKCRRSLHPVIIQAWKDAPSFEWEIPVPILARWARLSLEAQEKAFLEYVPSGPTVPTKEKKWNLPHPDDRRRTDFKKPRPRAQIKMARDIFINRKKDGYDLTRAEQAVFNVLSWILRMEGHPQTIGKALEGHISFSPTNYHPAVIRKIVREELASKAKQKRKDKELSYGEPEE